MVYHRTGVRGQEFSKDFFLLEYTILTGAQVAGRAEVLHVGSLVPRPARAALSDESWAGPGNEASMAQTLQATCTTHVFLM